MAFHLLTDMDNSLDFEESNVQGCHSDTMELLSRHARKNVQLWACDDWEILHEIDTNDIPLASGMNAVYGKVHNDKLAQGGHKRMTHQSGISHHHVQMALKLACHVRTGRYNDFKDYFEKLTQPYAISDKATMRRTSAISMTPRHDGLPNSFTPKIAKDQDGCLHFLLQTVHQLDSEQQSVSVDACPHMHIAKEQILSKKHSSGRCKHCLTSYVSSTSQVCVFSDFGTESSPSDLSWLAHLQSDIKKQGSDRARFGANKQSIEALFMDMDQTNSVSFGSQEKRVHKRMHSILHKMKGAMKPAPFWGFYYNDRDLF